MRYSFAFVALASMTTAQVLDLGDIAAAPAPLATGPAISAVNDTVNYAAAASGSAAVTGVAFANATASQASSTGTPTAKAKRDAMVEKRTLSVFCQWLPSLCPSTSSGTSNPAVKAVGTSSSSQASACSVVKVPTAPTGVSTTTNSASTPVITTYTNTNKPTPTGIPTTCTKTWTNTFAFINDPACPTPYETGTYCGFVNPEDPCSDQPAGSGPVASPDTTEAFLANTALKNLALNAKTPSGYALTFQNLNAATAAASYLGLFTLTSYDTAQCAAKCDASSTCTSFNLFSERDPALNPSAEYCCPNPASITNYKCTLWGSTIDTTTATNTGQYRDGFQVVIAGSNGYTKANTTTPATPAGCSNAQKCSGGAHSHSSTNIGTHFFPGPYNPQFCASYASAQNVKNGAAIGRGYSAKTCTFFNAYMLKKNGKPQGTYCSLFAQAYEPSTASYNPGWLSGNFWSVETSWSWTISA